MTQKNWFINLSIVVALLFIDQLTKSIALNNIEELFQLGPIGFVLHFNPGAMLGAFSDLPPVLRIVSLSTAGAFLVFIYMAIQYLIPIPARTLRIGMSILLGGILGNVTDRILNGAVTDFIFIAFMGKNTPAFNFADMIQWVGYVMIVYYLLRYGGQFWPEQNTRKKVWVNPNFQVKYVGTMVAMAGGYCLITGVFFYTYLKVTIEALIIGSSPAIERKFLIPFFITFFVIALGFMLMVFILSRILSHRVAGPLFAFELFLKDLLKGKNRKLRLRAGDEFQHLEKLSDELRVKMRDSSFSSENENDKSK